MVRKIKRNMARVRLAALAATAAAATLPAKAAMTNDWGNVGSNVVNAFDVGTGYGLTILGWLLALGAIVTGVKIYRRR